MSLQLYESMSELTANMVVAAREQDWDRLCELEREVAALRERLMIADPVGAPMQLDPQSRERKLSLIRRMLDDDRSIRSYTEPWMDSVRRLLSSGRREQSVRMAYNAHAQ